MGCRKIRLERFGDFFVPGSSRNFFLPGLGFVCEKEIISPLGNYKDWCLIVGRGISALSKARKNWLGLGQEE